MEKLMRYQTDRDWTKSLPPQAECTFFIITRGHISSSSSFHFQLLFQFLALRASSPFWVNLHAPSRASGQVAALNSCYALLFNSMQQNGKLKAERSSTISDKLILLMKYEEVQSVENFSARIWIRIEALSYVYKVHRQSNNEG